MTLLLAYIGAGAFAVGVLVGGWVSYEAFAQRQYVAGVEAGQADERQRCEEKIALLTVRLEADGLALQVKETARVRALNQIQDAAREAARVAGHEELGDARVELARVIARVRAVETAARAAAARADDRSRLPRPIGAPAGTDGAACPGSLPLGGRESLVGLAAEADVISAKYRVCLGLFRQPASPP